MSYKRVEMLRDASRFGYNIQVTCRACGHMAVIALAQLAAGRPSNFPIDRFRFRCLVCDKLSRHWNATEANATPPIRTLADLRRLRAERRG